MRDELALVIVENEDGTVAVQAIEGNANAVENYKNCNKGEPGTKPRMTLVTLKYDGIENVVAKGECKILNDILKKNKKSEQD